MCGHRHLRLSQLTQGARQGGADLVKGLEIIHGVLPYITGGSRSYATILVPFYQNHWCGNAQTYDVCT